MKPWGFRFEDGALPLVVSTFFRAPTRSDGPLLEKLYRQILARERPFVIVTDVHGDALPVDALQRRAASVMKLFRLEMERYCCASILVLRSEPIRAAVAAACAEADTRHRVIFTTSLCEAAETAERELGAAGLAIHAKARELLVSMQRETLDRIA